MSKSEKESNDHLMKMATTGIPIDPDKAIAQAHKNLAIMKDGYVKDMEKEFLKLESLIDSYISGQGDTAKLHRDLNNRLHELKATAETFGYHLITDIAGSLGTIFSLADPSYKIPEKILKVHLDSLKLIYTKAIAGSGGEHEQGLVKKLVAMTETFIEKTKNKTS